MGTTRPLAALVTAAAIAALSACDRSAPPPTARFALERQPTELVAVAGPTAESVEVAVPPAVASSAAAADAGVLVVRLDQLVATERTYRVQAVGPDLDHVPIRITGPGMDFRVTISRAQLEAGVRSVYFNGLPGAELRVVIEGRDPKGLLVSHQAHQVEVRAGVRSKMVTVVIAVPASEAPPSAALPEPPTAPLVVATPVAAAEPSSAGLAGPQPVAMAKASDAGAGPVGVAMPEPLVPTAVDGSPAPGVLPPPAGDAGPAAADLQASPPPGVAPPPPAAAPPPSANVPAGTAASLPPITATAAVSPAPLALNNVGFADLPGWDVGDFAAHPDGSLWVVVGPNWRTPSASQGERPRLFQVAADGTQQQFTHADLTFPDRVAVLPSSGKVFVSDDLDYLSPTKLVEYGIVALERWVGGRWVTGGVVISGSYVGALHPQRLSVLAPEVQGRWMWGLTPVGTVERFIAHHERDDYWRLSWRNGTRFGGLFDTPLTEAVDMPLTAAVDRSGACWLLVKEVEGGVSIRRMIDEFDKRGLDIRLPQESGGDLVVGHDDTVWVACPSARALLKLSSRGVPLMRVAAPAPANRLAVAPDGDVWAYHGPAATADMVAPPPPGGQPGDLLMRFRPDGTLRATYDLGLGVDLTKVVVAPDGTLWCGTASRGLLAGKVPE